MPSRTWFPRELIVRSGGLVGRGDEIPSKTHVATFGARGDGVTDDTTAIQAAYDAAALGYNHSVYGAVSSGILEFAPGAAYVISGDPALLFDEQVSIEFNNCTFLYRTASGTAIHLGPATGTGLIEKLRFIGHVAVIHDVTISHDGTQTPVSQLTGTGIKFRNVWTSQFLGSAVTAGFQYGYYFEGDGTGCTVLSCYNLRTTDCLVDFYFKPATTAASYVTSIELYHPYAAFNTAWYSGVVGTRILEGAKNTRTLDGIRVLGGIFDAGPKERKIKWDGDYSLFSECYYDPSNGGTDIEVLANSLNNTFHGGTLLGSQVISDSGTRTRFVDPARGEVLPLATVTEATLVAGVDAQSNHNIVVTLTAARVVGAPTNPQTGQRLLFTFIQGGAGAWAVTWNAVFKVTWSDTGNAAGTRSSIPFIYNGSNWIQEAAQAPYV